MPTPAIAANAYAALAQLRDQSAGLSRDAVAPEGGLNFGSVLKDVVTAVAESETAIQTMVAVRDKVIAAYEEILKMPI